MVAALLEEASNHIDAFRLDVRGLGVLFIINEIFGLYQLLARASPHKDILIQRPPP